MCEKRIQSVQKLLKAHNLDAILIDNPTNIFYLTHQDLSTGTLLIHATGAILLVDGRYYESCKQNSTISVMLKDDASLENILSYDTNCLAIQALAFDQENTSYLTFKKLDVLSAQVNKNRHNAKMLTLQPTNDLIKEIRSVKDVSEITYLTAAADLGSVGYDFILSLLKEGCSETEVAAELEIFWKRKGSQGLAFDAIIAFGANSSKPHHHAGDTRLKNGDSVLIDIGVKYRHYHSDMTRVVFYGNVHPKIKEIYPYVLDAQLAALDLCKPGTCMSQLDRAARAVIESAGYGKNFTHSLGHGVGLEIHELPTIRSSQENDRLTLKEGMVITIEPGIYLPDIGGVRIEDTVVITKEGHVNLTQRTKDILHVG